MRYTESDRYFTTVHPAEQLSFKGWVFAQLAKRVGPQLQAYWSDLYHDAQWIEENVQCGEETTFFYSYNDMGTNISFDPWSGLFRENRFLVRITVGEGDKHHIRIGEL